MIVKEWKNRLNGQNFSNFVWYDKLIAPNSKFCWNAPNF
jgi:hypothetical protein